MALEMNDLMALSSLDRIRCRPMSSTKSVSCNRRTIPPVSELLVWFLVQLVLLLPSVHGSSVRCTATQKLTRQKRLLTLQRNWLTYRLPLLSVSLTRLMNLLASERSERLQGDYTISQTITDTVSGQQASNLTAQQAAELSAVNSVMQQTYSDFVTGRASLNPTPVSLYSSPRPCDCPASGCGCNG